MSESNHKSTGAGLLVTGSIGIDTVHTPFGSREDCLGGSAIYFSMAACHFTPVRFVGVVGKDCPFDLHKAFQGREIDLTGLEVRPGSKTFRWAGTYQKHDINERTTDHVELNVLAEAPPPIPAAYRDSQYIFLANTHPALQVQLLGQLENPRFVVADTMNLWIENEREHLLKLFENIHALVLNDSEALLLTKEQNLIAAAKKIVQYGLDFVVVKKGQHGTLLYTKQEELFLLPAYPTDQVKDPTGAGDTFAGAMMGYLAKQQKTDLPTIKKSLAYGTAAASLVIEDFSIDAWQTKGLDQIQRRYETLCDITRIC